MNSLKTIYSRITTLKASREVLQGIGIEMTEIGKNGETDIRPVNDILGDLASRWFTLSNAQRQQIAVQVAGRYQLSRFLALMNNWETATNATNTAVFSQGSAMRENAEYMKSFEARINQLKNSWTELALAIGDAFLKSAMMEVLRGLTALAGAAVKVVDTIGVMPVLLGQPRCSAERWHVHQPLPESGSGHSVHKRWQLPRPSGQA
jgi:TP901 family phage tail tape measure protein